MLKMCNNPSRYSLRFPREYSFICEYLLVGWGFVMKIVPVISRCEFYGYSNTNYHTYPTKYGGLID